MQWLLPLLTLTTMPHNSMKGYTTWTWVQPLYIYGAHEQLRTYVGISQGMVGILCKIASCLATRQLDGRGIQTQWPGYSGIALEVGHCPCFSIKSTMFHIKLIMQHIMQNDSVTLGQILNWTLWGVIFHIFIHMLLEMHIQVGSQVH